MDIEYLLTLDIFIQILIVLGLITLVSVPLWFLAFFIKRIARFIRSKRNPISRKRRRNWNKTRDRLLQNLNDKDLERKS